MTEPRRLQRQGLYDPGFEHDACGVGFVANIKGVASHDIVQQGLQVLQNLTHRGACGCDPLTGDGAGILMQMPDAFLRKACAALDITLPPAGEYGVGMVFLPPRHRRAQRLRASSSSKIVREEGPEAARLAHACRSTTSKCGPLARRVDAGHPPDLHRPRPRPRRTQTALERKLYVIRKRVEHADPRRRACATRSPSTSPSLSSPHHRLQGPAAARPDPGRSTSTWPTRDFTSALALVHPRFSTNTLPVVGPRPPVPLHRPQRRDQHAARQHQLDARPRGACSQSPLFGDDIEKLFPIIEPDGSDSATFDNALELLVHDRPLAAARGDDDDPRGVAEPRDDERRRSRPSTSTTPA